MNETKHRNKNALRSRRMIIEAYKELLENFPANKITVTKIVEIADLNRSTFYAHFNCPNDVLAAIEKELIEAYTQIIDEVHLDRLLENPLPLIEEITSLIEKNHDLNTKLISGNRESTFLEKLKDIFIEKLLSDKETLKKIPDKDAFDVNLRFLAGGFTEILRDWFEGNTTISLDKLSIIVSRTIRGCISTCIE
jgi:AcrR family transcriptional regulator